MQTVSGTFAAASVAAARKLVFGVSVAWTRAVSGTGGFFTIGTSTIGGPDVIKSGGSFPAFYDRFTYYDETTNVRSWSVDRSLGQFPYGTFMAQADVELRNTSKRYLPMSDPTIGAYILPNRPMKISTGFGTESIQLFVGFSGVPENTVGKDRLTKLHAFDAFDYLNSYVSTTGPQTNKTKDQIIITLLTEAGFGATQYSIDASLEAALGYFNPSGMTIGDVLKLFCESEAAVSFVDENGIIQWWNRQHIHVASDPVRAAFTYANIQSLEVVSTPIFNDVRIKSNPRSVKASALVYDTTSALRVPAGSSVDQFYPFSDDDGDLPVTSVTPISYLGVTSGYVTNDASDGSGAAVPSGITLTQSNLNTTYKVTYANANAFDVYITAVTIFGTAATVDNHIDQRYQDTTSQLTYGVNPGNNGEPVEISNDAIGSSSTAASLGYVLTSLYGSPNRRYKIPIFARPELQFGDKVTVTILDTAETKTMIIVGQTVSMGLNADLQHELIVEERPSLNYFTIGTSQIGGTDSIAP